MNILPVWKLVKILIQHAAKVFSDLSAEQETAKQPNQKQLFFRSATARIFSAGLPNRRQTPQYS
jgi:hypothetical protein